MYNDNYTLLYNSYGSTLCHHGVKGQKHGHRRWQNPDGSLTPAGREHYGVGEKIRRKVDNYFTPAKIAKIGASLSVGGSIISKVSYDTRKANISKAEKALEEAKRIEVIRKNRINEMLGLDYDTRIKQGYDSNKIIANGNQATRDVLHATSALASAKSLSTLAVPILSGAAALAGLGLIGYGTYKAIKKRKENNYVQ